MGNTAISTEPRWLWQSNANPWSDDEEREYTSYPPETNALIERAFLSGKQEVMIDQNYKIDLIENLQVNIQDTNKQRRVMRQPMSLRRENRPGDVPPNPRFHSEAKPRKLSFGTDERYQGCEFINEWLVEQTKGTLEIDNATLVKLAIRGIEMEAMLLPDQDEAIPFAKKAEAELGRVASKGLEQIQESCISLYTEDSFLYRIINESLRDDDKTKRNTLGPFCYLLYSYNGRRRRQSRLPKKIVLYRGERLSPEDIKEYRDNMQQGATWRWTQFVSTTRNIDVAKDFSDGNTVYVIEMNQPKASEQGYSISSISQFSREEEVLLRPGIRFTVKKIEEGQDGYQQKIHIDILSPPGSSFNQ